MEVVTKISVCLTKHGVVETVVNLDIRCGNVEVKRK